MTPEEERYLHVFQSLQDLNGAWVVLRELRNEEATGVLAQAAFRYALVEYSKPYKRSRGVATKKHWLTEDYVPAEHLDLHRDLIRARDQIHAHSDLTVREATLRIRDTEAGKIVTPVWRGIDIVGEYRRLPSILDLVEQTIERLHGELVRLGESLPENSRPTPIRPPFVSRRT